ncbi:YciC family protein [Blochmannia endosymbiont of Camponotus sp.]|uniref:YciC family protein n=1 Tax=Blochmannia endosymbiont of Camponotus sp. TaxID=700220 RepID=UPI0020258217|nr:YciC family protein [Blochmannia endosymbiont of Camponotus sp.]URJ23755.1 envelope biogenesis factor ElyC [Blochmannia endosymbiont of Camponotus sp.]URJ25484.1 envelope biogenesis factor ElyC [Blochmannia endosymbiont of Camponotus sp.]
MIIKVSQDVLCFIRNYYINITTLIFATTLMQASLDYILLPKTEDLIFMHNFINRSLQDIIKELSSDQQYILLKLSAANSISKLLSSTFLFGSILTMLHVLSTTDKNNQSFNIINIIKSAIPMFPKLLLLIFYTTLCIQLGLMIAIVPGILLTIIISLTPIIITTNNISIMEAIRLSIKVSYRNIYLTTPPILLWFLMKTIFILIYIHYFHSWIFIVKILINSTNNILSVIILIYLYRLYMIIRRV